MPAVSRNSPAPFLGEAATWRAVGASWRQLFGDFRRLGVSFEWHEFTSRATFDWSRSFHPQSIEICLNLAGSAEVGPVGSAVRYGPWTAGFYRQGNSPLRAIRAAAEPHQFITVELSPAFLARHLGETPKDLHPLILAALQDPGSGSGAGPVTALNTRQRELIASLQQPPVLASAQTLWFQAKAIELMGEFFFQPSSQEEFFCHRQQRVARDRVDAVLAILRRNIAQTPPLEQIAREVGCSQFYLSRTFSKETGQTIPQYLRQLRMEKAASLLRTGRFNVTEVALEVGYNSLSHFSQTFHQTYGCCPGLYPMALPAQSSTYSTR